MLERFGKFAATIVLARRPREEGVRTEGRGDSSPSDDWRKRGLPPFPLQFRFPWGGGLQGQRGDRLAHVMEQGASATCGPGDCPSGFRTAAEDAIGAAFAGGPVALAYSRFDERTRASAHQDYLTSIEGWRRGSEYDWPGEFVIAHGTRE